MESEPRRQSCLYHTEEAHVERERKRDGEGRGKGRAVTGLQEGDENRKGEGSDDVLIGSKSWRWPDGMGVYPCLYPSFIRWIRIPAKKYRYRFKISSAHV